MKRNEFITSLKQSDPPGSLSALLRALWWDRKGDWDRAHAIAQKIDTADGSRVHAYLHRKEGDGWNARYWYSRAGLPFPPQDLSLEFEWETLLEEWTEDIPD